MKTTKRCFCLLLALLLPLSLSGCVLSSVLLPELPDVPAETEPASYAVTEAADRGPMPETAVSWQEVFFTKKLPAEGWVAEDEAAFLLENENGEAQVAVRNLEELRSGNDSLGRPPRTHYFEDRLDERYQIVFSAFDMAIELGCRRFSFPSKELGSWDVSGILKDIEYTYRINTSNPQLSSTKEHIGTDGEGYHFLTFTLNYTKQEDMDRYREAVAAARRVVSKMPKGLNELEQAKYLYRYTATHIQYDSDDYYEDENWGALYDALIKGSAVCTGYAETLCCLYNLVGIDCLYVSGWVQTDTELFRHAWNIARVGGSWYVFDATWDATVWDDGGYRPLYFGLSDAAMDSYVRRNPLVLLEPLLPECTGILDPDYLFELPVADGE